MTILDKFTEGEVIIPPNNPNGLTMRTRLLFALIPSVMFILMVTGYITYLTSTHFLNQALERSSRLQVKAVAHEIEGVLAKGMQDLLFISRNFSDVEKLRKNYTDFMLLGKMDYREVGFISQKDTSHLYFVSRGSRVVQIQPSVISSINPDPRLYLEELARLKSGDVWISPVVEVEYPFPQATNPNQKFRSKVIYFGTPYISENGEQTGFLLLSMDVRMLRNVLSLYNSAQSPLWAFPRTPEVRFAFVFDLDGWMLFQSEDPEKKDMELTTDLARGDYINGTLGKPGLASAFRPAAHYLPFWKMVSDVKDGKFELIEMPGEAQGQSKVKSYYLSYTPIRFQGKVIAGIAYIDRTRFTLAAGYKHLDMMLILSMFTIVAVSLIIFILSNLITKPIFMLAAAVNNIQKSRKLEPIDIRNAGYETHLLQNAINNMMDVVAAQMAEIRKKDLKIQDVQFKEKVELESEFPKTAQESSVDSLPELVGFGDRIEWLKSDILKAAGTDADVLIVGETGTGKQLTAEAIHRHSRRGNRPFISINCGELSENLLQDSLFGHVKGAFTEAKTDRKGAFLEADGGTLFLDEIQTASSNVQQALLRTVAVRKIKPLGSDKEFDVDVRLICATNIDLRLLIDKGQFRSDLYFRLKVITIATPPLREHIENIPVLVDHCLRQLRDVTRREGLGMSKGALLKMKRYPWPGNVRELINCMTRAAVMAENDIIQAEDVLLDGETGQSLESGRINSVKPEDGVNGKKYFADELEDYAPSRPDSLDSGALPPSHGTIRLSSRQQKVYPYLLSHKMITRSEYQQQVGENVSARTAIYDLQDLVKKGMLQKQGSGPATRYVLIESV
ncbi:MAG: sigma 54-interacting transcriptional regulator [Desulfosalsimonadaceae bacterium]|nr:sigma 54-interacting transcriptional regulator [Desulfosalsimonadaceae bacterium]